MSIEQTAPGLLPYADKNAFIAQFSPAQCGFKGLCPRCQKTSLFKSPLKIKQRCENCDLDYGFAAPADGPAFFVMSIMCFLSGAYVLIMRFTFDAPGWLVAVTTLLLVSVGTAVLLHLFRGWFVCTEYFIKIRDGRLDYLQG